MPSADTVPPPRLPNAPASQGATLALTPIAAPAFGLLATRAANGWLAAQTSTEVVASRAAVPWLEAAAMANDVATPPAPPALTAGVNSSARNAAVTAAGVPAASA